MIRRLCDICEKHEVTWYFKKRWKIFKWMHYVEADWKEEMEVCDGCMYV